MSLEQLESYLDKRLYKSDVIGSRTPQVTAENRTELLFAKLEELGYNLDEFKPILEQGGNILIIAGAGAGKTTLLILKIIYDLLSGETMKLVSQETPRGVQNVYTPEPIFVGTFLRSGARELKEAFNAWLRRLNIVGVSQDLIKFGTLHSEYYDILSKIGVKLSLCDDFTSTVRSICTKYAIRPINFRSKTLSIEDIRDIECIFTYARNRLDDKRYTHPLMEEFSIDEMVLKAALDDFKTKRREQNKVDYEDMQELVFDSLQKYPSVVQMLQARYKYVYLDEFQDTSQIQWEILKYYIGGVKKAVVIGDDDQTIYSWRGSDNNIIVSEFEKYTNSKLCTLTTNYRCGEKILKAVIPSIALNTNRHMKELRSGVEGGEINVVSSSSVNYLVEAISKDLLESKIIDGRSRPWTVGVLGRTNQDLLMPAILLELDGNISYTTSKSINLKGRLPRQILGTMDLLTKRYTPEFRSILSLFVARYEIREVEMVVRVLENNKNVSFMTISDDDMSYSAPTLFRLRKLLKDCYTDDSPDASINAFKLLLGYMVANVYSNNSLYNQKAKDFIYFIVDLIENHEKFRGLNLAAVDTLFNLVISDGLDRRASSAQKHQVRLSTVHDAKGKEWDSVYIWNDIEGVFPASVGRRPLTSEELEEERRVHYIAWTRARKRLTIFTRNDMRGKFLQECALSDANQLEVVDKSVVLTTSSVNNDLAEMIQSHIKERMRLFGVGKMERGSDEWLCYMKMSDLSGTQIQRALYTKVYDALSSSVDSISKMKEVEISDLLNVVYLQALDDFAS